MSKPIPPDKGGTASAWYKDFFDGVVLDLWRKAIPPEQTRLEVDFLEKTLKVPEGGKLLDVPCGNGRHSRELAARGYRVTGVDISEEFLEEARATSAAAGIQAEWVLGDMGDLGDLKLDGKFDGAFCFGNSFGYLNHEGTAAFLAGLSGNLEKGARFVIETGIAAESILPTMQTRIWYKVDDMLMLSEHQYDSRQSRMDTEYTFLRDGKTETRKASSWVFTVAEMERLLNQAGLRTLSLFESTEEQPFKLGSPNLILTAEKQ